MVEDMTDLNSNLIKRESGSWEIVIGLEVHAQVISDSKLFSGSSTSFGAVPNSHVSLVDAAMPGMLPVINDKCIEQAVRTGLGLGAKINLYSIFDRKNYFYPDLPQGYQISQFSDPIVSGGTVFLDLPDGEEREIRIERIHLEQDAGKSIHDQHPNYTYVDLNRSGVALMEIVSKPDMRSSTEAATYVRKLRSILRYLGTCDGNMDQGSLRCDVNVSVRFPNSELGTRCEIKNVNSIRFIQQAIEYESNRQIKIIEDGGSVDQQTRLFDSSNGTTRAMRSKEEAHDYRYFPDPDLLPLIITEDYVDNIRASLPELPDTKKNRLESDLGISSYQSGILVSEKENSEFFELLVSETSKITKKTESEVADGCANAMITNLFGYLNKEDVEISKSPITSNKFAELLSLQFTGVISGRIAKEVFELMILTGKDAADLVEEKGLKQVSDTNELEKLIDEILISNQKQLEQYRSGKDNLFGFFVGQVMKLTNGQANPGIVNKILKQRLDN